MFLFGSYDNIFNPTTEAMSVKMKNSRQKEAGSKRQQYSGVSF